MVNEQVSFEMISYAGDAFSKQVEALKYMKGGNHEEAERCIHEAEMLMNKAHRIQTKLIVKEANGEANELSVLLIHAQDTLMNTILMSTIIKELIDMYKLFK
ncbi:PTS lactose/cellobiose transporter subunit IIA [Bacillaceae bacterium SIJ1]|uniref:PTS lactose/cellobiose transporter subunit IIA n=1 Tax=Litoribacterium kuwaitense TaxID=1398745 RepID=UPI0013EDBF60|nr:PTS lactose/cellobiose transporter subunit IIA [Litoribacterium kuwaitense]NGP46194.1 PTS lactose/cellobiose transporter subunit IIA [Litoribacterium kuwaitense]